MPWICCRLRALFVALCAVLFIGSFTLAAQPHIYRLHRGSSRALLVGYFPQWGLYQDPQYTVKELVANGGAGMLSQINYAQGFVTHGQCSVADPAADLGTAYTAQSSVSGRADNPASLFRGYFHQLQELKRRYPRLRILISLEGRASDFAQDAQPQNRRAFVASCVDRFLRGNFAPGIHEPGLFDGFDIDWESPQQQDAANFQALLEEFRRQMKDVRRGALLSVAVGPGPGMLPGTDFHAVARLVDEVGVMNYDYTGPWNSRTGFLAPLFASSGAGFGGNIARSMELYEAAGVPRRKLLMGIPFYGYSWTGVDGINDGLFQSGRAVHGDQPYRYIRGIEDQFSLHRDPGSHAAWLFDGQTFWTCDDPVSLRYKASYARREHLRGVMIWELSGDTEDGELLHVVHQSLAHPMPSGDIGPAAPARTETAIQSAGAGNRTGADPAQ